MIENKDELSSEQKKDLQKFVSIAIKNKNLWWANGDLSDSPLFLYLAEYFSVCDINLLNEILIEFPDEETKKVLQLLSENECANDVGLSRSIFLESDLLGLYAFRFKKSEDVVNNVEKLKIPNPFDTKQLLEELQNVLMELKTDEFEDLPPWRSY